jgi:hypothetical protein
MPLPSSLGSSAAAKRQVMVCRAAGLDLEARVFEVEVAFDTASGIVA